MLPVEGEASTLLASVVGRREEVVAGTLELVHTLEGVVRTLEVVAHILEGAVHTLEGAVDTLEWVGVVVVAQTYSNGY